MLLLRGLNSVPINNWRVMPGLAQSHLAQESEPATRTPRYARPQVKVGPALHLIILFLYIYFFKLIKLCIFKFL